MMVESTSFIGDLDVWDLAPSFDDNVVILVVVDWDRVVNDVTDLVDFAVDFGQEFGFTGFCLFLFFFVFCFELELLFALVFLVGFFFIFDDVLDIVPFLFK